MTNWHEELVAAHSQENKPVSTGGGWMPISNIKQAAKKQRRIHKRACATHSSKRAKERMGVVLRRSEIKVMSNLVRLGHGVHLSGEHYLLRYGSNIFHVIYSKEMNTIKTIYPQDDIAGLMIGTVPRDQLKKLIQTR